MAAQTIGLVLICLARVGFGRRVQATVWQGIRSATPLDKDGAFPSSHSNVDRDMVDAELWSQSHAKGCVNSTKNLLFAVSPPRPFQAPSRVRQRKQVGIMPSALHMSTHASDIPLRAHTENLKHKHFNLENRMSKVQMNSKSDNAENANDSDDDKDPNGNGEKPSSDNGRLSVVARVAAFATAAIPIPFILTGVQVSVATVLAAAFLNLLGFTMAGPITPALGAHFGLDVGASLGCLTSAYPFGMLFGLLVWPSLSDRIGRKPVIALSLFGAGAGLLAQGLAVCQRWPLSAFLALRAITGSMAGASPVAKAYLADVGNADGKLPRYMAWRDAASSLAFIVGPLLSGTLYLGRQAVGFGRDQSLAAVIATSGLYSILASVLVIAFVSETPSIPKVQTPVDGNKDAAVGRSNDQTESCPLGARMVTAVASICVVSALFNLGTAPFDAFFPSLLKDLVGLDEIGIGRTKATLATLSFVMSASLCARIQKRLGTVFTCFFGLCATGFGLAGIAGVAAFSRMFGISRLAQICFFWLAAAIYQIGIPLLSFSIPTMLLQCVPRNRRGAVMGLDSSINAVARILSAPLLGALYGVAGPGFCFGTASGVIFLSAATVLLRRFVVLRS